MAKNIPEMIHEFTEAEKKRSAMEAELFTPIILGEFVRVVGSRKTGPWTLNEVTESDLAAYHTRMRKEGLGEWTNHLAARTVVRFLEYACEHRWIEKKPWDDDKGRSSSGVEGCGDHEEGDK